MKRFVLAASVMVALGLCSVALAASFPFGKYKTTVHTTALGGALNGIWTIKFSGMVPGSHQSLYTVTDNGAVVLHGRDTIKGTKISFKDLGGRDSCLGTATTGTYKFKLTGSKLKFTKVSETKKSCGQGRAIVLTSGTFTKVG
jgi:hypothetical protein